jgi:hypothetical protein
MDRKPDPWVKAYQAFEDGIMEYMASILKFAVSEGVISAEQKQQIIQNAHRWGHTSRWLGKEGETNEQEATEATVRW